MRFHLTQLRRAGKFLNPWKKQPFLWLLHYGDTRGQQHDNWRENDRKYDRIKGERLAMLPEHVRKAISPPEE